jgi:hypothetical protein
MHSAPSTSTTRDDADQFLAVTETDLLRGSWFDPNAGAIRLDVYAPRWIVERPVEVQSSSPQCAQVPTEDGAAFTSGPGLMPGGG